MVEIAVVAVGAVGSPVEGDRERSLMKVTPSVCFDSPRGYGDLYITYTKSIRPFLYMTITSIQHSETSVFVYYFHALGMSCITQLNAYNYI